MYAVQIKENSLGPAGRVVHGSKEYFEDRIPRLIIVDDESQGKKLLGSRFFGIIELNESMAEPSIYIDDFYKLMKSCERDES